MKNTPDAFVSPWSADYWKSARSQLKNIRVLALAGLVVALAIVLECLPIYLMGPSLKIYFSFLVVAVGAYVYGPLMGIMAGAAIDTLGFLLSNYGEPYFPGFLLTAMLSGLVYGLFLYCQRLSVVRFVALRLVVNYGLNVLLGSVWKAMLYGKGYYYYFVSGLVKNTLLLPVEVILLMAVFRILLPTLQKNGLVPRSETGVHIPLWRGRKTDSVK